MGKQSEDNHNKNVTRKKIINISLLFIGGFSLFFAQSGLWINNVIFDQKTFTNITTNVILSEDSRNAISQTIVDRAFENRPVADRLIGDRAVNFISNLLDSDISERALSKVSSTSYSYLTSSNRKDIAIDLTSIKEPLSGIISFAENRGREVKFDPSSIPDQIVLINSNELPNFASYIRTTIIASFFLWLITVLTFGTYIFINRRESVKRIYTICSIVILVSVLALSTGPFIPPAISSFVDNINLRTVVNDLTSAYLTPFSRQLYLTILISLIAILITRFRWIFIQAWQSSYKSINKRIAHKS